MRNNGKYPSQNGVYKFLDFNGIPKNQRGTLVRKFTNIDITHTKESLEAAEYIQQNWKQFIDFLKSETGKDIWSKFPRRKKRTLNYHEYM